MANGSTEGSKEGMTREAGRQVGQKNIKAAPLRLAIDLGWEEKQLA